MKIEIETHKLPTKIIKKEKKTYTITDMSRVMWAAFGYLIDIINRIRAGEVDEEEHIVTYTLQKQFTEQECRTMMRDISSIEISCKGKNGEYGSTFLVIGSEIRGNTITFYLNENHIKYIQDYFKSETDYTSVVIEEVMMYVADKGTEMMNGLFEFLKEENVDV